MSHLQRAVESTWALVLARFVMPALLSFAMVIGTWYASRIESLFVQVVDLRLDQRETSVRLSEIERRLNAAKADPIKYLMRSITRPACISIESDTHELVP